MHDNSIQNYSQAVELINQQTSARAKAIAKLRKYVDGTQYDGRPSWFSADVPLWERQPCVVYTVVEDAINQKVDLILGEERYPDISARSAWGDDTETVEESESTEIDKLLSAIETEANLKTHFAEVLEEAMGCSTGVFLCGVRDENLFVETIPAEWCLPKLKKNGECLSLEIMYGYIEEVKERNVWKAVPMLFRRIIDAQADITFNPVEIKAGNDVGDYTWSIEEEVVHGLGFCPVRWYPFMKKGNVAGRVDGYAIHRNELDEVDAMNFSLSQRHRAALYSGDPQWTETGVSPGEGPQAKGRNAKVIHQSSVLGGPPTETNMPHKGGYVSMAQGGNGKVRKKGPGEVWTYTSPDAKITLHTLPGDALDALDKNTKDILSKLEAKFGVVSLDPEKLPKGNALAASSMKKLMRRMFASCDRIRSNFADNCMAPVYAMLLRIAISVDMELPGITEAKALIEEMGKKWNWNSPPFEFSWGEYQSPDPEEEKALVDSVIALRGIGLLTDKVAVKMLKGILMIENIDDYLEELKQQKEDEAKQLHTSTEMGAQAEHSRALELNQVGHKNALELETVKAKNKPKPKVGSK
jgi:hypothetical protein